MACWCVKHTICTEHHQPRLHFKFSADYSLISSLLKTPASGTSLYLTDTSRTLRRSRSRYVRRVKAASLRVKIHSKHSLNYFFFIQLVFVVWSLLLFSHARSKNSHKKEVTEVYSSQFNFMCLWIISQWLGILSASSRVCIVVASNVSKYFSSSWEISKHSPALCAV